MLLRHLRGYKSHLRFLQKAEYLCRNIFAILYVPNDKADYRLHIAGYRQIFQIFPCRFYHPCNKIHQRRKSALHAIYNDRRQARAEKYPPAAYFHKFPLGLNGNDNHTRASFRNIHDTVFLHNPYQARNPYP